MHQVRDDRPRRPTMPRLRTKYRPGPWPCCLARVHTIGPRNLLRPLPLLNLLRPLPLLDHHRLGRRARHDRANLHRRLLTTRSSSSRGIPGRRTLVALEKKPSSLECVARHPTVCDWCAVACRRLRPKVECGSLLPPMLGIGVRWLATAHASEGLARSDRPVHASCLTTWECLEG
jgi:hypothetical protein